jgi:hypothetical protein
VARIALEPSDEFLETRTRSGSKCGSSLKFAAVKNESRMLRATPSLRTLIPGLLFPHPSHA